MRFAGWLLVELILLVLLAAAVTIISPLNDHKDRIALAERVKRMDATFTSVEEAFERTPRGEKPVAANVVEAEEKPAPRIDPHAEPPEGVVLGVLGARLRPYDNLYEPVQAEVVYRVRNTRETDVTVPVLVEYCTADDFAAFQTTRYIVVKAGSESSEVVATRLGDWNVVKIDVRLLEIEP
ncbi:MAG TPA: hypothetical protein VF980_00135 [Thermoanaerobaculia bacterium]